MSIRPRTLPWLLIAMATPLAGCGSSELLGPDAEQGIAGTVLIGPQCPVQSQQNPCPDEAHEAWIDVRTADGLRRVTRVMSGEDGTFRVGLEARRYRLVPENGSPSPVASPVEVDVEPGTFTEVLISYDTGIR